MRKKVLDQNLTKKIKIDQINFDVYIMHGKHDNVLDVSILSGVTWHEQIVIIITLFCQLSVGVLYDIYH